MLKFLRRHGERIERAYDLRHLLSEPAPEVVAELAELLNATTEKLGKCRGKLFEAKSLIKNELLDLECLTEFEELVEEINQVLQETRTGEDS